MSTQDCELHILTVLNSNKTEMNFGALLKALQNYSNASKKELNNTLVAVIRRLIYRGKISMTSGLNLENLTKSSFKIA